MELLRVGVLEEDEIYPRGVIAVLNTPELAGQKKGRAASNVKATLPHEGLTSQQLLASIRAAAAGLQVESASLSSEPTGGPAPGAEAQRPGPLVHLAPSRLSGGQAGGWDIRRGRG